MIKMEGIWRFKLLLPIKTEQCCKCARHPSSAINVHVTCFSVDLKSPSPISNHTSNKWLLFLINCIRVEYLLTLSVMFSTGSWRTVWLIVSQKRQAILGLPLGESLKICIYLAWILITDT